ncbi:MAG: DUF4391 domain-containing protein [Candidatus Thiodiazotropha sp. (ex. Lucinisca nassula)]|nr:DUF4391 domain-containing protein [Candidatus Thiodiazotropha sp. (ex. Lucinisca nassula)]
MTNQGQQHITEQVWQSLNLPESCLLNSRIYKKMLLESADLSSNDKKVINEGIDTLVWRYTLKPETINIPKLQTDEFDYPEIAVIHVTLKSDNGKCFKHVKRLVEIIQRAIPYPLVLVISHDNMLWLSLANKRQNLADSQKLMVEAFFDSNWIDGSVPDPIEHDFIGSLGSKQLDWSNFYTFYQGYVDRMLALQAARHTGQFRLENQHEVNANESVNPTRDRQTLLQDIRQLEEEESSLKTSLQKETQFNRRLALNMSIKRCQQQIQKLTNDL